MLRPINDHCQLALFHMPTCLQPKASNEQAEQEFPVVFLDVDDVICVNRPYGAFAARYLLDVSHPEPEAVKRRLFTAEAKDALLRVTEELQGNVRFVISSTWRQHFSRDQIRALLEGAGLLFVAERMFDDERWRTPGEMRDGSRRVEIEAWLETHGGEKPFVVLDDVGSGASLIAPTNSAADPLEGRVVLCELDVGLVDAHVPMIVVALRSPWQRCGGVTQ